MPLPTSCLSPFIQSLLTSASPHLEEEGDGSDLEKEEGAGGYTGGREGESPKSDKEDEVEAGSALEDEDEAGSAAFLIDFPAVASSVSSAVLGLEEEFSLAWQGAATAALQPALLAIHRQWRAGSRGRAGRGWGRVEGLVSWTSHPGSIKRAWHQCRDATSHLELLLLLTPVLERSLGDLLTSVSSAQVPALLRDLLQMEELLSVLGSPCLLLLRLLLGSPNSLNLRNLVWHGFLSPEELSPVFASCLLLIFPSIGHILSNRDIHVTTRPQCSLARLQLLPSLPLPPPPPLLLHLATSSSLLPPQHFPLLHRALEHSTLGRPLASCLLLLPLLEAALRQLYVSSNGCPERRVTAEATQLYTTFSEMVTEQSQLQEVIGGGIILLLMDLLILPSGPRARDRLSHGEVRVDDDEEQEHLSSLVSVLTTCLALLLSPQEFPLQEPYTSSFHPFPRLASSLLASLAQVQEVARARQPQEEGFQADFQSEEDRKRLLELTWCEGEVEVVRQVKVLMEHYRGDCLYRARGEYELVGLLDRISEQVSLAAGRMTENLAEKLELLESREMRSRARKTYRAMLDTVPRVRSCLLATVVFLARQLEDKASVASLGQEEFGVRTRRLRQGLKAAENIAANVQREKNKWEEAARHCGCLEEVILAS